MKVRKIRAAMDIPRLASRDLEQAGDLGEPPGREGATPLPRVFSPLIAHRAASLSPASTAAATSMPVTRDERPPARHGIDFEHDPASRVQVFHQVDTGHLGPDGPGGRQSDSFHACVEPARLSPPSQRHVRAPLGCRRVPAHAPQHPPPEHEDAHVVARVADHPLEVEHGPQPLERVARPPGDVPVAHPHEPAAFRTEQGFHHHVASQCLESGEGLRGRLAGPGGEAPAARPDPAGPGSGTCRPRPRRRAADSRPGRPPPPPDAGRPSERPPAPGSPAASSGPGRHRPVSARRRRPRPSGPPHPATPRPRRRGRPRIRFRGSGPRVRGPRRASRIRRRGR